MFRFTVQRTAAAILWSFAVTAVGGRDLNAQGPTSAAIAGRILDDSGNGLQGVEVAVTNQATGISMRGVSRADGRYLVSGLEVGGPYSVTVRRIGLTMRTKSGFFLSLGQQLQLDIALELQPMVLERVETQATQDRLFSRAHMGTAALLSDSVIHRMPVINRDLYDLVRLAPQMSTSFALATPGAGPRVNSIRIDGVSDQLAATNLAAGALYGGKVLPLDAVKEYQVLFSPFDVRHGGFAGVSVNAVTRSGTNELQGSVFGYGTNERLGPNVPLIRASRYEKQQFGFSLGGPIVRDRLHFFLSTELQRRVIPAVGPYVGQRPSGERAVPAGAADIARFQQLLNARGLDGGSAGAIVNPNPSSSTFLRLDAPIARWNSRFTVRGSYGHADSSIFARPTVSAPTNCPSSACFPLSSLQHSRWLDKRSVAAQLISNLSNGAYNELVAGHLDILIGFRPAVRQPLVLVTVPGSSGAPAVLQAGTHEVATGQRTRNRSTEITNNFSIAAGSHRLMAGYSALLFDLSAFQLRGSYGIWEFASLDSLQAGTASRYRVTRDTGSVTAASGANHAVYVSDEWEASSRLSFTLGLRADAAVFSARPPYVREVDSTFGVRTDKVPATAVSFSPRLGFNYDLTPAGGARTQVRGGAGLFTGRPPLFWLFGGFSAYGLAARTLQCGSSGNVAGAPPAFTSDFQSPPLACANGATFGATTNAEIDVIQPHLRLPQTARVSLAADAQLPVGFVGTVEVLHTRARNALFYSSINLSEPLASDRHGRLMYGTVNASGVATPSRVSSGLGDVVSIANQSKDGAYDLTGELRRSGRIADVAASVSYGRSRDVQSPRILSTLLTDTWRFARPVAGRQDDLALGTSDYDQPLRVRVYGSLHSPWRKFQTDLSILYVGGSGVPYTYVAGGTQNRGDLNADGATGNDPIYIPKVAFDTTEIRFGGSQAEVEAQQAAFERFIDGANCLREQRGRIMSRNSCRSPWMSLTNLSIRQALPAVRGQTLAFELQVFNVLNLVNRDWGRMALPAGAVLSTTSQIPLLSQTGQTTGPEGQPIYRFDPSAPRFSHENFDTYYQLQLAVRYNF